MTEGPKKPLSSVKAALLSNKLWAENEELKLATAEPVAIIGSACRLPGGITNARQYWQLLEQGVDAIEEIPAERWDRQALFDPDPSAPGKSTSLYGGFLRDVDKFDPKLFGIAPREAVYMDPQQRLLLEVAWEAFEDSGNPLTSLLGSKAGVFFGLSNCDYGRMQLNHPDKISAHTLSGTAPSIASGRLSYLYNLRGPSVMVDTACSSSLTAVHYAVQSLRTRESNIAIAGGISLNLSPEETISLAKWGMLSQEGRCKTFDASANGFVRSEGCGVVVLKRLADALKDGDPVRAVIRGTAINQDGRSNVLTAPNGAAQQEVIRAAMAQAGVNGAAISFVETHGTGTKVGDPIEVEALVETLGYSAANEPCYLGAVKANLGHLEAAAGVAALIKIVLCLEHKAIPKQVHFRSLNPLVSLDGTRLRIPTELTDWPEGEAGRIAGVSSFGFSGTNVHIVVEQAPKLPRKTAQTPERAFILPISAGHREGLERLCAEYAAMLTRKESLEELSDICYTASRRRDHHGFRYAAIGYDAKQLRESLGKCSNPAEAIAEPKIGFVFAGQGSEWLGMAKALFAGNSVFRESLRTIDSMLAQTADWSIEAELHADEPNWRLDETRFFQPTLFAIQLGLVDYWASVGVQASAAIGHSVGEIAAACCSGYLTREAGLALVEMRGRLMDELAPDGAMAAVRLSADKLAARLPAGNDLVIAAVNSPQSCTVSGTVAGVDKLLEQLQEDSVHCHKLSVSRAFHSPFMDDCASALKKAFTEPLQAGQGSWISSVTGNEVQAATFGDDYWARNVRDAVQFADATKTLLERGVTLLLEIGPNAVLAPYLVETAETLGKPLPVVASMRREADDLECLAISQSELYRHGCALNWRELLSRGQVVSLPCYPFERDRLWLDWSSQPQRRPGTNQHAMLSEPVAVAGSDMQVFSAEISLAHFDWISEHVIAGVCLLPAASFIELMISAGKVLEAQAHGLRLSDFSISQPLLLHPDRVTDIQLQASLVGGQRHLRVFSRDDADRWLEHASAGLQVLDDPGLQQAVVDTSTLDPVDPEQFYAAGASAGIEFGPQFRLLRDTVAGDAGASSRVQLVDERAAYWMHPAEIDAGLQTIGLAFNRARPKQQLLIPLEIAQIDCVVKALEPATARAVLVDTDNPDMLTADVGIVDSNDSPSLLMRGVRMQKASSAALAALQAQYRQAKGGQEALYRIAWNQLDVEKVAASKDAFMLVSNDAPFIQKMTAHLAEDTPIALVASAAIQSNGPITDFHNGPELERACNEGLAGLAQAQPGLAIHVLVHVADANLVRLEGLKSGSGGVADLQGATVKSLFHIARGIVGPDLSQARRLSVVTESAMALSSTSDCAPGQAAIWGFINTFSTEHPEWSARLIDCVIGDSSNLASLSGLLAAETNSVDRVAIRDGVCWQAQLSPIAKASQVDSRLPPVFELHAPDSGVFDDLHPVAAKRPELSAQQIEIKSEALGINFRDVLNVLNEVSGPSGKRLGAESAGVVVRVGDDVSDFVPGDRVMAFALGGFASHLSVDSRLAVKIPQGMSSSEAASIPVVFLTAKYALDQLVSLRAGQTILIHSAAGGVGLAAVQIALARGAFVYATASSVEKQNLLREMGVAGVYSSRSLDFAEALQSGLGSQRLDFVLNVLSGEFIPASMALLSASGHFIELGKRDDWDAEKASAAFPGIAYTRFDLGEIAQSNPALIQSMFTTLRDEFEKGQLQPLPISAFSLAELPTAFRFMAKGNHIGKLVVSLPVAREEKVGVQADASYLITGGLGALGLAIAGTLADAGATSIALAGRSAPNAQASDKIAALEARGVDVRIVELDVADAQAVTTEISKLRHLPKPLKGIVHSAGILRDGPLINATADDLAAVLEPKIQGSWNLHRACSDADLDFFVLFSSASAVLGWPGQTNYAAGNAYMDALAHYRQARGLPAMSINWGVWASGGMASRAEQAKVQSFASQGLNAQSPELACALFAKLIDSDHTQLVAGEFDWPRFVTRYPAGKVPAFFQALSGADQAQEADQTPSAAPGLLASLQGQTAAEQGRRVRKFVESLAGEVMGLGSGSAIKRSVSLNEQGLDSLLAVELRNKMASALDCSLPASLLFDYPTVNALAEHVATRLATSAGAPAESNDTRESSSALIEEIDALTESEAEAELLRELNAMSNASQAGRMDEE